VLHLEPGVREHFDRFLSADAPELLPLYRRLYPGTRVPAGVEQSLGATVAELRQRYGLADRPSVAPGHGQVAREDDARRVAGSQLSLRL
jgi:hypothetical protein